jgi:hypothetical protein
MFERDPIRAYARKKRAQRRAGIGWMCPSCRKERRAFAKIGPVCYKCDRISHSRAPYESNHVFGKANSDAQLLRPINDHRAVLSVDQYDWPVDVRENPDGSPVLAAAGMRLGRRSEIRYILEQDRSDEILVELDAWLRECFGPKWWVGTPLERYAVTPAPAGKRVKKSGGRSRNKKRARRATGRPPRLPKLK